MVKKQCVVCSTWFEPLSGNGKLCSEDCRKRRLSECRAASKRRVRGKNTKPKLCVICADPFTPAHGNARYCLRHTAEEKRNHYYLSHKWKWDLYEASPEYRRKRAKHHEKKYRESPGEYAAVQDIRRKRHIAAYTLLASHVGGKDKLNQLLEELNLI
jgi:hypothetical protein